MIAVVPGGKIGSRRSRRGGPGRTGPRQAGRRGGRSPRGPAHRWWSSPRVPSPPGWAALGRGEQRPADPAVLQAVSAVGQHRLMRLWQDGSIAHGLLAGQVLLAPLDFVHRTAVPARPRDAAPPGRPRRRPRGQRERRRGRRGDPLRRQRPPGRAGGPPGRRGAARAAHRHAGPAHRRPPPRRRRRRSSRRWSRSTTSSSASPAAPGTARGQRRHGLQAGGGQDRHLVRRARP